jgi:hypothetical protein
MKRPYDKQYIAHLLNKFMAGETTLSEEQTLATFFRTHEVDEEWMEYKEMFALFDNGQVDIESSTRTRLPLRWLMTGIAASIMLLIGLSLLMKEGKTNEVLPEIAQQTSQQSTSQPTPLPIVEEKKEEALAEVQPKKKPVKKRRKAVRKQSTSIEEPVEEIMPAEPVVAQAMPMPEQGEDPIEKAARIRRELRQRGEQVEQYVAMLNERVKQEQYYMEY